MSWKVNSRTRNAKPAEPLNLYSLKPRRMVEWEVDSEGRVTLLVPKFRRGILARWLQPRLRRPLFRIKLDEFGSYVWQQCNGDTPVKTIGEEMKSRFGNAIEPVYDRIAQFLQQLENSRFLTISEKHHP